MSAQGLPTMPPFPFNPQPVDAASMPQFYMQQAGGHQQQMPQPSPGWVGTPHPDSTQQQQQQQQPGPPADGSFNGQGAGFQQMQGQAYFQEFAPAGQQVVGTPMN